MSSPLSQFEQLLAFCDWERKHNPHFEGKPHIAEWAATEIERLERERIKYLSLLVQARIVLRGPHTEQNILVKELVTRIET